MLSIFHRASILVFFFNDTATTEIYTLSLHDALPIFHKALLEISRNGITSVQDMDGGSAGTRQRLFRHYQHLARRSEEHTSELQSLTNLVCRLLLEKKKKTT